MIKPSRVVLTIAGSDSSGGAGIQADIKTISATGSYAASVITALTAQNTLGVQAIQTIPHDFVEQQLKSVLTDLTISAVKIGIVHNKKNIDVIAAQLKHANLHFIVLDPVMISKNGCKLLDPKTFHHLQSVLFPLSTLITPNISEAQQLLGTPILSAIDQKEAAIMLGKQFKVNVLVKGGHIKHSQSDDVLFLHQDKTCHWFRADRIHSPHTHGTGCSLSSAIASYLAHGMDLIKAIANAKRYITQAIISAQTMKIGHGQGPLNHFYFLNINRTY